MRKFLLLSLFFIFFINLNSYSLTSFKTLFIVKNNVSLSTFFNFNELNYNKYKNLNFKKRDKINEYLQSYFTYKLKIKIDNDQVSEIIFLYDLYLKNNPKNEDFISYLEYIVNEKKLLNRLIFFEKKHFNFQFFNFINHLVVDKLILNIDELLEFLNKYDNDTIINAKNARILNVFYLALKKDNKIKNLDELCKKFSGEKFKILCDEINKGNYDRYQYSNGDFSQYSWPYEINIVEQLCSLLLCESIYNHYEIILNTFLKFFHNPVNFEPFTDNTDLLTIDSYKIFNKIMDFYNYIAQLNDEKKIEKYLECILHAVDTNSNISELILFINHFYLKRIDIDTIVYFTDLLGDSINKPELNEPNIDLIIEFMDFFGGFNSILFHYYSKFSIEQKKDFNVFTDKVYDLIINNKIDFQQLDVLEKELYDNFAIDNKNHINEIMNFLYQNVFESHITGISKNDLSSLMNNFKKNNNDFNFNESIPLDMKDRVFTNKFFSYDKVLKENKNQNLEKLFNFLESWDMKIEKEHPQNINSEEDKIVFLCYFIKYIRSQDSEEIDNFVNSLKNQSDYSKLDLLSKFISGEKFKKYLLDYLKMDAFNIELKTTSKNQKNQDSYYRKVLSLLKKMDINKVVEIKEAFQRMIKTDFDKNKILELLKNENNNDLISIIKSTEVETKDYLKMSKDLLPEYFGIINAEKNKYVLDKTGEIELEFRPVKSFPFLLYGVNAGLCIWKDIDLFKKKNFFIIDIVDKKSKKMFGCINLYIVEDNNKKYIVLPGINPNTSLMKKVDAKELYSTIERMLHFIVQTDYYIPNHEYLISNISDIENEVRLKNYKNISLFAKHNFSLKPEYNFQELLEVEKKDFISIIFDDFVKFLNANTIQKKLTFKDISEFIGVANNFILERILKVISQNDFFTEFFDTFKVKNILASV